LKLPEESTPLESTETAYCPLKGYLPLYNTNLQILFPCTVI